MNVEDLVKSPAKCDELLEVLNEIARDICAYEYGLPIHDDGSKARLREAIYQWSCGGLVQPPPPQPAPHSPLWHMSEEHRAACHTCNPGGSSSPQPGEL